MSSLIKIPLSISAYTMNMYNPDIIWATKSKKRQILHSLPFTFRGLLLPRLERQAHPIEGASKGFNSALKQFFMTSTLEIEKKMSRIWCNLTFSYAWCNMGNFNPKQCNSLERARSTGNQLLELARNVKSLHFHIKNELTGQNHSNASFFC